MVRKRPLTSEEEKLWQHITRYDKPLKNIKNSKEKEETAIEQETVQPAAIKIKNQKKKTSAACLPASVKEKETISKKLGDYSGIDRNTAERFRKGEAAIDAKLDLHGMTTQKAHKSLISFIEKHVKLGSRRLLVITGKGNGILRSELPNWLSVSDLCGWILAFDKAQAKHGGDGAYYILLKRKRLRSYDT